MHHRLVEAALADLTRLLETPESDSACRPYRSLFVLFLGNNSTHAPRNCHTSHSRKIVMTNLSPRHVQLEESVRLGVQSGWYSTKVSGTFVTVRTQRGTSAFRRLPSSIHCR